MEIREFDAWIETANGRFYHIQVFAASEEEAVKEVERYICYGEEILGVEMVTENGEDVEK